MLQYWIDGTLVIDNHALANGNIVDGANNVFQARQYAYLDVFVNLTAAFGPPERAEGPPESETLPLSARRY